MRRSGFRAQASFTVEAAMLMCVILPVLLALLYLGMFLHDKGVLNGAAQEVAATAETFADKESAIEKIYNGRWRPAAYFSGQTPPFAVMNVL